MYLLGMCPRMLLLGQKECMYSILENTISQSGHVTDYKNVHNFHSFLYPHPFMI